MTRCKLELDPDLDLVHRHTSGHLCRGFWNVPWNGPRRFWIARLVDQCKTLASHIRYIMIYINNTCATCCSQLASYHILRWVIIMSIFWYTYVRKTAYVRTYVRTYVRIRIRAHIHKIHTTTYTYVPTYARMIHVRTYVRTYVHTYTVATYIRMHMAVGNMPKMRVDPSEMNDNIALVMTMMQDKPVRPAGPCSVVWDHRMATRSMDQGRTSGRSSSAHLKVIRAYSSTRRGEALE